MSHYPVTDQFFPYRFIPGIDFTQLTYFSLAIAMSNKEGEGNISRITLTCRNEGTLVLQTICKS